ncbi:hypothetical protein QTO34_006608 [Cnephaeus nilssonii]|uniref:Acylphosphatase n=1 Tax=Cnephaeus nilssonii TaxID=3371016 RepID=A0AA40LIM6_CNENI|nr:hypothetical protein QTO34_006608 [Eptesicus nilssonii]
MWLASRGLLTTGLTEGHAAGGGGAPRVPQRGAAGAAAASRSGVAALAPGPAVSFAAVLRVTGAGCAARPHVPPPAGGRRSRRAPNPAPVAPAPPQRARRHVYRGPLKSVDYEVFGRVQGVCFRMYTEGEAKKIGVVGWVKNTNKGTVTGQVQGPEEKVNSM